MTSADQPGSPARLRPLRPSDHAEVLALNERHVALLAPLDEPGLSALLAQTDRADAIDVEGELAGFVLTFAPGAPYDSANFLWFAERFGDAFYYLDRIVVDDRFRRRGVAGSAYDEIERAAAPYGRLCLEVNIEPPNLPSLEFHRRRGYAEVGRREDPTGKAVAMLVKELDGWQPGEMYVH